ncbi:MAG: archaellin/type IV pilin N-terminal domain-containing protein [Thermoplasmata archaeon]
MKAIYGKEKGVSPVIATILMVAITVVLASAVYLMVSGYIGSTPSKPASMAFVVSDNTTSTQFLVAGGNISVTASSPLIITIQNNSGIATVTLTSLTNSAPTTLGTYKVVVHVFTVTGLTYLAAGDILAITGGKSMSSSGSWGLPLSPGTTVTFTYEGSVFYKYTV